MHNFINIVTPCSRPENLLIISESINIPRENYRWIVVFDSEIMPDERLIPKNCEAYCHKDPKSISGNGQRNFAIDKIDEGYIYFNDDDTKIHPEFWESIKDLSADFASFIQLNKDGSIRLEGIQIALNYIDSHNFIVNRKVVGNTRFILDEYAADGHFAVECFNKSTITTYIRKPLSIYNILR